MMPVEVGERISAKRKEKGLTQRQLAEMVHVTDKAVSKWEQGKNFPDLTVIEPLSVALDTSPAELLGFDEKSAAEAFVASTEIYEEARALWLQDLLKRAWTTLIFNAMLFIGLVFLSRYMDERAFYGYPMCLTGVMYGLTGTLIGNSIWTIRTSYRQLKRESDL